MSDDIYFSSYKSEDDENRDIYSQNKPPSKRKKKKKKHRFRNAVICLFLIAGFIVAAAYGYIYSVMNSVNYNEEGHLPNTFVNESSLMQDDNVHNILFLGVDRRVPDVSSRSDSMMLFSIDNNNKKIKITSFLRDMWVEIPSKKEAKLNASCMYGGAQLVMDTIEYNFNVKIDNYVLVDFDMFAKIIDTVGGVDVPVTQKESDHIFKLSKLRVAVGENIHLNGTEALWYSRIRKIDSDFMRTSRQRKVINSVIENAKDESLSTLISMAKEIVPTIETDFSARELTALAFKAAGSYIHYDIEQNRVPADGTWSYGRKSGASVLLVDLEKNRDALRELLYTKDEPTSESTTKK